jgi:hypothetical protein
MKRFIPCPKCDEEKPALPTDKAFGGGYERTCERCGTGLVMIDRSPRDLHYELLDYAQAHLKEGEVRAAVVEVFAALDVFARRWGKAALVAAGTPGPVVERFVDPERARTRALLRLVDEIHPKKRFGNLPGWVYDLRNSVIHEGKTPTPDEAASVVREVRLWIQQSQYAGKPDFDIPEEPGD